MAETWLKCTECRTDIPYGGRHYVCSVSTCKRSKMQLVFCSPTCWDSHLSTVRHRDAWAEDAVAPTKEAWQSQLATEVAEIAQAKRIDPTASSAQPRPAPSPVVSRPNPPVPAPAPVVRRAGVETPPPAAAPPAGQGGGSVTLSDAVDKDVLIVISKMKKYIKDRSGMNCSDAIAEGLSDHVRALCDDAIRSAAREDRKTVLERDITRRR